MALMELFQIMITLLVFWKSSGWLGRRLEQTVALNLSHTNEVVVKVELRWSSKILRTVSLKDIELVLRPRLQIEYINNNVERIKSRKMHVTKKGP